MPIAVRLATATLLGFVVALLYRISRPAHERTHGFGQTLTLLSPLIAMVTIAVGQNVAAAFTLVGTLAIVRFRTAMRDTRDSVFLIHAVAIGMAFGGTNLVVAFVGTAVIGLTVFLVRSKLFRSSYEADERGEEDGHLRITLRPPECADSSWLPLVQRFAPSFQVLRRTLDRRSDSMDLRILCHALDATQSGELLQALHALPEVVLASYTLVDDRGNESGM